MTKDNKAVFFIGRPVLCSVLFDFETPYRRMREDVWGRPSRPFQLERNDLPKVYFKGVILLQMMIRAPPLTNDNQSSITYTFFLGEALSDLPGQLSGMLRREKPYAAVLQVAGWEALYSSEEPPHQKLP